MKNFTSSGKNLHFMSEVLAPLGFRLKENTFWRKRGDILHHISLSGRSFSSPFNTSIAVQPLIFPFETFILSLGGRLSQYVSEETPKWNMAVAESETMEFPHDFSQALIELAVPWLDRFQSPADIVIINKTNNWGIWPLLGGSNTERDIMIGLCAMDAGLFEDAEVLLSRAYYTYKNVDVMSPKWQQQQRELIEEVLTLLEKREFTTIKKKGAELKEYTRGMLGI